MYFTVLSLQWEIYDAYVYELQKQEKNKEKQKAALTKKDNKSKKKMMLMETQVNSVFLILTCISLIVFFLLWQFGLCATRGRECFVW